jgi:uncharacterized membrane protein YdjX (TVP38/TMEM64 family)
MITLGALALFAGAVAVLMGADERSLAWLYAHSQALEAQVSAHAITAGVVFVGIYMVVLGVGLPFASLMSVLSGYFFGLTLGGFVIGVSISLSASLTYWLGRTYVYRWLHRRHRSRIEAIKEEVDINGAFYVLAVRLSAVFPFFWVNLLFGASGLRWQHYIWPTIVGMAPSTALYIHLGHTLSSLDSLDGILETKTLLLFLGLGVIALLPVLFRRWQQRKKKRK